MKIILQTVNFKAGQALEKFIFDKASRLSTLSDEILNAQIILSIDPVAEPENKLCEIHLRMRQGNKVARTRAPRYEKSVIDCVSKLETIFAQSA